LQRAPRQAADKYKIYLSMSYIGNDWQDESRQDAEGPGPPPREYKDKVDLKVQVAGPNAQKQIQQINAIGGRRRQGRSSSIRFRRLRSTRRSRPLAKRLLPRVVAY